MQSEALGLLGRIVVMLGSVLRHEERVLQAAGRQQSTAEATQPTQLLRLVVPRPTEPGRALPAQGAPVVFATTDIHRPIDQDVEAEPGAGAELQDAYTTLQPIAVLDQAHPGDLLQSPDALHQLLTCKPPSPERGHGYPPWTKSLSRK